MKPLSARTFWLYAVVGALYGSVTTNWTDMAYSVGYTTGSAFMGLILGCIVVSPLIALVNRVRS